MNATLVSAENLLISKIATHFSPTNRCAFVGSELGSVPGRLMSVSRGGRRYAGAGCLPKHWLPKIDHLFSTSKHISFE